MSDAPPPARLRVFVALAPPDPAKEELVRRLHTAYEAHPRLRWNRVEDWHLTLAFLGEVPAELVPRLCAPLARVAGVHRPPRLALRGSGTFDDRVLWSGVDGELDALHRLAGAVRSVVRECGVPGGDRVLRPHLTLARARRGDLSSVGAVAADLAGFSGRAWDAGRLHLVGSNDPRGPGPVRYRDIVSWPLGSV
ncbi:RNA 2',3'-cyclic phosphodiesterase [Streptomyces sp. NPDC057682]|uniref:RNA 2',3'-cyclic phosphodiesterase n=1 Tax=unclassified Streptomyces TaxID=2593676 RepID=UPI00364AA701